MLYVCARCGERYHEIDNLGTWGCVQQVFLHTAQRLGGQPLRPEILKRPIYIAADHISDRDMSTTYGPADDLVFNRSNIGPFQAGVLHEHSVINVALAGREILGGKLSPMIPSLNGALFAIRRYDYKALALATSDTAFAFGKTDEPTQPSLQMTTRFMHNSLGHIKILFVLQDQTYNDQRAAWLASMHDIVRFN